jgi:antitoxin VapB
MHRTDRLARRHQSALERVRAVIRAAGVPGVVLTRPGPVAWATGGMNPPIDRTAPVDTVWLAVGPSTATVITTEVEAPRIRAELAPAGVEVAAVAWWDDKAMADAAAEAVGSEPAELGSDGHPAFGHDLDHALTAARLPLSDPEQEDLRDLGHDAAAAVEQALREWAPGEADREIAARVAAAVERSGADAPCLLVGGDERLRSFRHPVANGSRPKRAVMAVLVARRDGLHVALTRHVATASDPELEQGLSACREIHRATLRAGRPGAAYGDALEGLSAGYERAGAAGEWRAHHQGGPIGYGQREFEIVPAQTDSEWWAEPIAVGTAFAWNPSLPGGAKDEDTYLTGSSGLELITTTGGWPVVDDGTDLPRPAVLEVA